MSFGRCKRSSPGDDNITYEMIKNLSLSMQLYILQVFNKIWSERLFPTAWRKAIIIPILKPGKPISEPASYRPICLTSCLCKVMERMVYKRLTWLIESKKLLHDNQGGSREGRNPVEHLIAMENAVQNAFIKGEQLLTIFFDIKDAYTMVWRYQIIRTLESWGIKGNLLCFIYSFLKDREFQVMSGNNTSDISDSH